MATQALILPGIGDSGSGHWQSLWEAMEPTFQRVVQHDWDAPVREAWQATLDAAIDRAGAGTVLVAHSLGCLLAAHWVGAGGRRIKGALLVAVPDPLGPAFPAEAVGFAAPPMLRFPFPSIVVASSDDPYASPEHARACALAWGSTLVEIGAAGHINADSGLGVWPEGRSLLQRLLDPHAVQGPVAARDLETVQ